MQHLQTALDALIGVATDVVIGAAASSARGHASARDTATNLRSEDALREIVGPTLYKLAYGISAEVERRAVPRFKSILAHPRHGREQLIDELDDAETEFNTAIHGVGSTPASATALRISLAIIRVRAITRVLGEQAFADSRKPRSGSAPSQRRRQINATDLGEEVARAVIGAIDAGDQWRAALEPLRTLEATDANRSGVATKILAFADMPEGRAILERIAAVARPHFPPPVKPASNRASGTDGPIAGSDKPDVAVKADRVTAAVIESLSSSDRNGARLSVSEIARRQREERRQK